MPNEKIMTQPVPRCPKCGKNNFMFGNFSTGSPGTPFIRCDSCWTDYSVSSLNDFAQFFPSAPALPSAEELAKDIVAYAESVPAILGGVGYQQAMQKRHDSWESIVTRAKALAALRSLSPEKASSEECNNRNHKGFRKMVQDAICGKNLTPDPELGQDCYVLAQFIDRLRAAQPPAEIEVEWPSRLAETDNCGADYTDGANDMLAACRAAVEKAVRKGKE